MNKISLIIVLLIGILPLSAQPWLKNLPNNKSAHTYFDYKNAFDTYWAPYNIKSGNYVENGVTKKAYGWKQFKRWEREQLSQINPTTGKFNTQSAIKVYNNAKLNNEIKNLSNNVNLWTPIGPTTSAGGYAGIGRINCIAFHPSDNNIYWVGAPAGGLWRTTDNGSSWTCLTDSNDVLGVSSIIIPSDYATSKTIYIGTGDRDAYDNRSIGILKSTDAGATWVTTGLTYILTQNKMVNKLLLDPNDDNVIIAATSNGIYKTTDGGTTWNTKSKIYKFMDMEYKPGSASVIYGGTKGGDIYLSTDSGTSWKKTLATPGKRVEIAVTPADPSIVYALVISSTNHDLLGIYKSTNSGVDFTKIYNKTNLMGSYSDGSVKGGQGYYDVAIAASPTDAKKVIVGGVISFRSTNGGTAWSCSNCWTSHPFYNKGHHPETHADKHNLNYRNNGDLFELNDGGVYLSKDDGKSWVDKSNGLMNSQIYSLSVSQTVKEETITGLQDNGTKLYSNSYWYDVIGGDGMFCVIDYTDVNTQYGSMQKGDLYRTTNHWNSRRNISPYYAGEGAWVTPLVMDPLVNTTIYAGYKDLYKSRDRGSNWTKVSNINTPIYDRIKSIAIAPSNTSTIYMSNDYSIWKTNNGRSPWTKITGNLPVGSGNITYITVKNSDKNTVWVTFGGYNSHSIYKTINGGTTWTNISNGLPSIPAHAVVYDKTITGQDVIYVGTQLGVFIKIGKAPWAEYNLKFPKVRIGDLDIYYDSKPANNRLRAGTYGRGLWEISLYKESTITSPIANFEADVTEICTGDTVKFTDSTINSPTSWSWDFSPNNVTYVNSTSSTSQNPNVKFNSAGNYSIILTATSADGSNTKIKNNYITVGGISTPFLENFEANSTTFSDWIIINPDADKTWELNLVNGNGNSKRSIYINNYSYDKVGEKDDLITPVLNLTNLSGVSLNFKHAYTRNDSKSDKLLIYASDNCGATFQLLKTLDEDGTGNFATTNTPFNSASKFRPITSDDWCGSNQGSDCNSIDISAYAGKDNVLIKFQNVNNHKNNLYLDDIEVIGLNPSYLTASFTIDNPITCAGANTEFSNTSENATSYSWEVDNVEIATTRDFNTTFTTSKIFEVKLTTSDGKTSRSTSQLISVIDSPIMPSTITGPASACTNGTSSNYTTSGSNGATAFSWSITPSTAGDIYGNGPVGTVTWNLEFNNTAEIKVLARNSCGDSPQTAGYSVNLTASPMAATQPTGPIELCVNTASSNYSCSKITNATSYLWTIKPTSAGTISNTNKNAVVNWSTDYTGSASIYVIGNNQCGNGVISPALTVMIDGVAGDAKKPSGPTNLCVNNGNSQYSVTNIPFANSYNWVLTPANAGTLISNQNFITIDWNNTFKETAALKVNATNSCGDGGISPALIIKFESGPPTPTITYNEGLLTSSSRINNQWIKNNYPISGSKRQTYTPKTNAIYAVDVSNSNGCKTRSNEINIMDVGINTAVNENAFELFPNPANDYLMITYAGNDDMILKFRNVLGKDLIITEFNNNIKLNLSKISSGVYFIEMYTKDKSDIKLIKKVIITKK